MDYIKLLPKYNEQAWREFVIANEEEVSKAIVNDNLIHDLDTSIYSLRMLQIMSIIANRRKKK
jgi:hypothetical protein